jgi:hypothetical protein
MHVEKTTPPNPSPKAGSHWTRSYGSYTDDELRALTFPSKEEIDKAIDLIYEDPILKGLPGDFVGRLTLIAPVDAVGYFKDRNLHFSVARLVNVEELSKEELAEERRKHGM